MSDKQPVPEGFYRMQFRCANCGLLFDNDIRKGTKARGSAGQCPHCGVRDNTAGVGHHEAVLPNRGMPGVGGREILHG